MNSERIKTIASLIDKSDVVVDIGCDHGYLPIYLKLNNLCKEVYASDISVNALNTAKKNFQKSHVKIKTFLTDGMRDIDEYFNTIVLAGMGTHTILHILEDEKIPNKLILASNNELAKLRSRVNKMGYTLDKELVIFENNHYYSIMCFLKGDKKLTNKEIKFGISGNKDYYKYLKDKNTQIMKKVPLSKKIELKYENHILKGLIEKK